jgi:NTE family protein
VLAGASMAYTVGKNSGVLNAQAGYSFDDTAPLARWFELGGFGRLSGLIPDQLTGHHMGLVTLALYRHLNLIEVLPMYAGFTLETGNVWNHRDDISFDSLRYSGSLFIGADTPIGPVYLAYGLADEGENTFYFYLGNPWKTNRY